MRHDATHDPPHAGEIAAGNPRAMGAAALSLLHHISKGIDRLVASEEQVPDYDQTFVVTCGAATPAAITVQLPRTVHYAELTISSSTSGGDVAVLTGELTLPQAQQLHNITVTGPSNAEVATGGGKASSRSYLDQSGYLTILFSNPTATGSATLRVQSLDRVQARAVRT